MTILLVPSPSYSVALLAPSYPHARVPTAHRGADWVPPDGWRPGGKPEWFVGGAEPPDGYWSEALVLARGGLAVPEGMDRAIRVAGLLYRHDGAFALALSYTVADADRLAARCAALGLGSAVVLP